MNSAAIFVVIGWMLASGAPRLGASLAAPQTAPAQPTSPSGQSSAAPPASAPKPCPAVSPSTSGSQAGCLPGTKTKKRRHRPKTTPPAADGPTKTVVRNGGTAELPLAISPGGSHEQVSQQLDTTNHLLAMTDENLKIIAHRQLNASQQDTVNQIKNYMEQSRKASEDGDSQRAYTLANKARMLSGDLVKH